MKKKSKNWLISKGKSMGSAIYKRKRISNLNDLDREEARLRKKTRQIEKEWVELLNPKQLAIDFALGFATNKIMGKKSPLKLFSSLFSAKKKTAGHNKSDAGAVTGKSKKNKAAKILKGVAIALAALQAVKLLVAYKKKRHHSDPAYSNAA